MRRLVEICHLATKTRSQEQPGIIADVALLCLPTLAGHEGVNNLCFNDCFQFVNGVVSIL
jgi:hypothetical protein